MVSKIIVIVLFTLVFVINIFSDKLGKSGLIGLTKPLLVPLIMLFYGISADEINWFIVAALFFGFLGDVFLLGSGSLFFKCGLGSFLIGNIVYSIAFMRSTHYLENVPEWSYLFTIPYIIYAAIIVRYLEDNLGQMKMPIIIYLSALLIMSFTSLCRIWNGFDFSFILPFIGSIFFITSDSCLAYQAFMKPEKNYLPFIMATYIIAQVLIMLGFL